MSVKTVHLGTRRKQSSSIECQLLVGEKATNIPTGLANAYRKPYRALDKLFTISTMRNGSESPQEDDLIILVRGDA